MGTRRKFSRESKLEAVRLVKERGVSVAHLAAAVIAARLMPDPAVMVAELFGERIGARARDEEVTEVVRLFPQGCLAVQFSANLGDDETLAQIAAPLALVAVRQGLGIVLFRARAAPWHDNLAALRCVAELLPQVLLRLCSRRSTSGTSVP